LKAKLTQRKKTLIHLEIFHGVLDKRKTKESHSPQTRKSKRKVDKVSILSEEEENEEKEVPQVLTSHEDANKVIVEKNKVIFFFWSKTEHLLTVAIVAFKHPN
jgi:hypothetical protein